MSDFRKRFTRQIVKPVHETAIEHYMLSLTPGFTAIVHPDAGISKNVLLQINAHAKKAGFENVFVDVRGVKNNNLNWDAGTFLEWLQEKVENAAQTGNPLFVMTHLPDTGMSPIEARNLMRGFTDTLRKIDINADGSAGHAVYVVATINDYELAKGICVNPVTGEKITFADYKEYMNYLTSLNK